MKFYWLGVSIFTVLFLSAQTRFLKHKVRPGETIYTIAAKYNADAKYLLLLNNFPDNIKLAAGDIVLIRELKPGEEPEREIKEFFEKSDYQPVKTNSVLSEMKSEKAATISTSGKASETANPMVEYNGVGYTISSNGIHVVEKGQTFYRISLIYGISVDELKAMNGLTSTNINVGQKLKVPIRK
jgi:LysM repeat protein